MLVEPKSGSSRYEVISVSIFEIYIYMYRYLNPSNV